MNIHGSRRAKARKYAIFHRIGIEKAAQAMFPRLGRFFKEGKGKACRLTEQELRQLMRTKVNLTISRVEKAWLLEPGSGIRETHQVHNGGDFKVPERLTIRVKNYGDEPKCGWSEDDQYVLDLYQFGTEAWSGLERLVMTYLENGDMVVMVGYYSS